MSALGPPSRRENRVKLIGAQLWRNEKRREGDWSLSSLYASLCAGTLIYLLLCLLPGKGMPHATSRNSYDSLEVGKKNT
jgi:hypothetical protein